MKRLLCAGSGPIYQIARVFRDGEEGRLHNPEFTLIEWYRPGFDHHALMDEVEALVSTLLGSEPFERICYGRAFEDALGIDPHTADLEALAACARGLGLVVAAEGLDRGAYLDFLVSNTVTPRLGHEQPCFLFDFPEPQAAFARVRAGSPPVSERFEAFHPRHRDRERLQWARGWGRTAPAPAPRRGPPKGARSADRTPG